MKVKTKHANTFNSGFTIIEVLMAIILLGILVTAVLAPMTGLFSMSNRTNQQLAANTAAQNVMEQAKGLWKDQGLYDRNCLKNVNLAGITAAVVNLDEMAVVQTAPPSPALSNLSTCDTATPPATPVPLKRLTITAGTGTATTTLNLVLPRP